MKHKAFRWIPAVLLAALLAGCGAETAPPQVPPQSPQAANSLPYLLPPPPNRTA